MAHRSDLPGPAAEQCFDICESMGGGSWALVLGIERYAEEDEDVDVGVRRALRGAEQEQVLRRYAMEPGRPGRVGEPAEIEDIDG
jgi:hypothetical protein